MVFKSAYSCWLLSLGADSAKSAAVAVSPPREVILTVPAACAAARDPVDVVDGEDDATLLAVSLVWVEVLGFQGLVLVLALVAPDTADDALASTPASETAAIGVLDPVDLAAAWCRDLRDLRPPGMYPGPSVTVLVVVPPLVVPARGLDVGAAASDAAAGVPNEAASAALEALAGKS